MDCGRLTIPIAGARNPAQAVGAAITYARRYQLGAVAGVAAEDDDGNSLDGTRAAPARPARINKAGQARAILSGDIGCKNPDDAEAAIRFATDYRLGAADLDTEGSEILSALHSLRSDCGGDWTGYLKSAVKAWEAQA